MKRAAICFLFVSIITVCSIRAQSKLSVKWEELTAADFREAIQLSKGTCLLPFGILEKHGPHLPLGTDLLNVRHASLQAAQQEFAVVFPQYYFGQIFEAKHEPGTVAYSMDLQLKLLQETTDEMARNGCKKIVIVNGHGGNEHLLPFSPRHNSIARTTMSFMSSTASAAAPAVRQKSRLASITTLVKTKPRIPWFPGPTWFTSSAPLPNPESTRSACTYPKMSTPASGGTPAFPTITQETVRSPRANSANGT